MSRPAASAAILGIGLTLAGCSPGVEVTYGHVRGASLNGTGAFAELLKDRGHEVRVAIRLTDELSGWADTIVRFAPYPGPIDKEEADWYESWLGRPGRRLAYIARDFDARSEYWSAVAEGLPPGNTADRARAERQRAAAQDWIARRPPRSKSLADHVRWFGVKDGGATATTCKALAGPWAVGIEPARAALPRHDILEPFGAEVHLVGDGVPLVIGWEGENESAILIVASGSFLLNEPLAHAGRRPLAWKAADWIDQGGARVAFIEGSAPTSSAPAGPPSGFAFLTTDPLNWVSWHLLGFGLLASLAAAVRLGRPRSEPATGAERPVAHAEALGDLLARTRDPEAARGLLDLYRRWRHPSAP